MIGWWWWVSLPRALARRFAMLPLIAVDGHVLLALGPVAGLLPPLTLAGGLYAGVSHPGFEVTFTESLALMLAALALGTLSTQLGALAVIGFAAGDFFLHHTAWTSEPTSSVFDLEAPGGLLANPLVANVVVERVPLLIQYALLAALAVGVPVGARGLAASVAARLRLPEGVHLVVSAALIALTAFVLSRLWAAAAPMVIRPVFTWTIDDGINGGLMPVGAVEPIQANADGIARTAALAVVGRAAMTWTLGRARPDVIRRAEAAILAPLDRHRAEPGVLRTLVQATAASCIAVLLLAGMIDDLWAAGALAAAFLAARLARSGLIPLPTRRWRETVTRIPVLVRYGGALLVMNGVAKAVIASSPNSNDRFQFLVWPVAGAALLMAVVVPDPPGDAPAPTEPSP